MTDHEKNHEDRLEIKWVYVLMFVFSLFIWGYTNLSQRTSDLDKTKLDKAVFEEHQRSISSMKDDIKSIREILETHAVHFRADK